MPEKSRRPAQSTPASATPEAAPASAGGSNSDAQDAMRAGTSNKRNHFALVSQFGAEVGGQMGAMEDAKAQVLATSSHHQQQARVQGLIAAGAALEVDPGADPTDRDALWRNTCEWINEGRVRLQVLSPTDPDYGFYAHRPLDEIAYIDATVFHPAVGGDYDIDPNPSDRRVVFAKNNLNGELEDGGAEIKLYDAAAKTDDVIRALLIHEIQHDADQSTFDRAWAQGGGEYVNLYQTEFRAYSVEHGNDPAWGLPTDRATNSRVVSWEDPVSGTLFLEVTDFENARQEFIFWHLVGADYDYVPENYTRDPAFKAMVDAYTGPLGGNMVNSVRIQALSDALAGCSSGMAGNDPAIAAMWRSAEGLDAVDRKALGDTTTSAAFWAQAKGKLPGETVGELNNLIRWGQRDAPPVADLPSSSPDVAGIA